MLYEQCPICGGDGENRCPSRTHPGIGCPICKPVRVVEVGLTRGQFDRKLLMADDAELILRAVASWKCELKRQQYDDDLMIRFHGGGPGREQLIDLPLSKYLRERLIQLVGKD